MKIGKVSGNVLKRSVLRQIHTKRDEIINGAGIGEDCAIFALSDTEAVISCMQEAAVAVQAETGSACTDGSEPCVSMAHVIQKCANNLAVCGAVPIAVMITFLLPESVEESILKTLMAEAEAACSGLSLQIVGGQTKISRGVTVPFVVVTGYGKAEKSGICTGKSAKPGHDIVVSKWIGLEGTALLAGQYREKLLGRYPAYLVDEAEGFDRYLSVIPEAATAMKSGVCAMHDASEGGILATLWELAEAAGVGLTIDLKKLPLRQETVEVCECLGCNPYELCSGGCLVMTCEDGLGLAAALEAEGIPAAIVGKITDSNDRIILNEDEVRYMDRPKQDEIFRLSEGGIS